MPGERVDTMVWRDEISNLWPTLFAQAELDNSDGANAELIELATGSGAVGDLFALDTPASQWLHQCASDAVTAWCRHEGRDSASPWRLSGELCAYRFGDYRELANEPGAHLAGVYCVNAPPEPQLKRIRKDAVPSRITLYDPRVAFNSISLRNDPYFLGTTQIDPRPGLLALWPGYLRYFTRVHLSDEPWILVYLRLHSAR